MLIQVLKRYSDVVFDFTVDIAKDHNFLFCAYKFYFDSKKFLSETTTVQFQIRENNNISPSV